MQILFSFDQHCQHLYNRKDRP